VPKTFGGDDYHEIGGSIYHNDPECSVGRLISEGDRRRGRDGLELCEECQERGDRRRERVDRETPRFGR